MTSLAHKAGTAINHLSAFNVPFNPKRRKINQYATRYTFDDASTLTITAYRWTAQNGKSQATGSHNANARA